MRADLGIGESSLSAGRRAARSRCWTSSRSSPPARTSRRSCWHLRRGLTAWHAAGQIHSDIQKGFVRAEVVGWDALTEAGGYAGATWTSSWESTSATCGVGPICSQTSGSRIRGIHQPAVAGDASPGSTSSLVREIRDCDRPMSREISRKSAFSAGEAQLHALEASAS